MDEKTAVTALAALAQEARLRVFRALVGAAPTGLTPSALSALLDIPGSTLSFHLKELVHAQLVQVERDGRHLIYRPALVQMNALLGYLTDHCCQGQGADATACTPAVAACAAPSAASVAAPAAACHAACTSPASDVAFGVNPTPIHNPTAE